MRRTVRHQHKRDRAPELVATAEGTPAALGRALWFIALLALLAGLSPARAASHDDNVEWNGVSHVEQHDRAPRCPVDGEAFTVRFLAYADDLTAARVSVDDGSASWVTAQVTGARGPYDIWSASVPATSASALSYYFELTDGSDTDYLSVSGVTDASPTDGGFAIDFATLEHAPVGATPVSDGVVFKVWSPSTSSANVRGEFNGWGTGDPMQRVGEHYVAHVTDASAGDMYKYNFSGTHWNTDPRAGALVPGDNYNAVIVDPGSYAWQVPDFQTPPFEKMVVYQLHVGTFAGRNDPYGAAPFPARYVDVTARASHLAELGVNAVMLNPITEFPGDYSAGYNPVTAWSPESKYGTPDELRAMVDELHAHGIAVLLDIVWNHFSFTDNFLWNYDGNQIYYDDPVVNTPWGDQADFDNGNVRDYFADAAEMWLEDFKLDGFRMDATSYMNVYPQEASGWSLMQRLNDDMDRRWVDKIAIAEQLPDNSWVTRPTALGGAGFDSQYYDEFTDRLREELLDASYGDPEMWKIRNIIYGGGDYLSYGYVTNYVELHDEAWPSSGGQRLVKTIDTTAPHDDAWAMGRTKLAQGLALTAPGIPAMLQGTEWLEDTDFGTDSENRIDWSKKTTYAAVFDYYSDIIALRTTADALRADAACNVHHLNESGNVVSFIRSYGAAEPAVVVANFSNTDYTDYRIGLPASGGWHEAVNSQSAVYGGDGPDNPGVMTAESVPYDGQSYSLALNVPAMGLAVLIPGSTTSVPDEPAASARSRLLGAYPNPFNPRTTVAFELASPARARVSIYDASGRAVRVLADRAFEAGPHAVPWDGRNDSGAGLASGVYFVRLSVGGETSAKKVVLLR